MLTIVTPPADIVTLADAKAHLRVTGALDDALISGFIKAATQRLDGRDGFLGRALGTQTWKLTLDQFLPTISIPLPPCQSITEIKYVDPVGDLQTMQSIDYQVSGLGGSEPAIIRPAFGKTWPSTMRIAEVISITFVAGYGLAASVPEPIRNAILMHVGHLYEHRESVTLGTGFITETPHGYRDAITDYRQWAF